MCFILSPVLVLCQGPDPIWSPGRSRQWISRVKVPPPPRFLAFGLLPAPSSEPSAGCCPVRPSGLLSGREFLNVIRVQVLCPDADSIVTDSDLDAPLAIMAKAHSHLLYPAASRFAGIFASRA